ncbi:hypothetical protein MM239_19865 [Belliella sp. DSM 111904]|uniref:Oxidoreductase FAD/NAD(P)-binding domain-containing protein n=1 Tax=Belliella filtrata TaxID=2923435 RepID=A0ABS9V6T5_9BACT|nr:hypothetical protein [Belliella filtrata]MCH7411653.1 hypothetical protein [Belliella filtrata]
MKSLPEKPLVFIAGGTGFAPIKALIEQQIQLNNQRKMELYWGLGSANDIYEMDVLSPWITEAPNLNCTIAIDNGELPKMQIGLTYFAGKLADAIRQSKIQLKEADAYIAGSPAMMPGITNTLIELGTVSDDLHIDSFEL